MARPPVLAIVWFALHAACGEPYTVEVGGGSDAGGGDGGVLTEDQRLAEFGLKLKGSWTGQATLLRALFETQSPWDLRFQPDSDRPQSGALVMGCFSQEACVPVSGNATPRRFHLLQFEGEGTVRGVVEGFDPGEPAVSIELQITEPQRMTFKVTTAGFLSGTFEQISTDPSEPPVGRPLF